MGAKLVWDFGKLCDPRNLVLVEVSRPLPRIIKHKPSAIVFSDRNESAQYNNLVRPEHKLFSYESSDGGSPSGQGDDDDDNITDVVSGFSSGLHRQFIISQKRKSMYKARMKRRKSKKEQEALPTVTETKPETTSTEVKEEGITFSEEQVRDFTPQTHHKHKLSFLSYLSPS